MKNKYLKLYFDNYNICNLIKKTDRNYCLCYDQKERCFKIINSAKNDEVCMKFDVISPKILKILISTRCEFSKKIFDEIEKNNIDLLNKQRKNSLTKCSDYMHEFMHFCSRSNSVSAADKKHFLEDKDAKKFIS